MRIIRLFPADRAPALLVLMRHGQSLTNTFDTDEHGRPLHIEDMERIRDMNDRDIPLTETGIRRVRTNAALLHKRYGAMDLVCQSDALRSIGTADECVALHSPRHAPPRRLQTPLLNERSVGYLFGLTGVEIERRFPFFQEHYHREGWFMFRPPGGESVCDVMLNRVLRFLELLANEAPGRKVLVCGHARWMQAARILLEGHRTNRRVQPITTPRNAQWYVYSGDIDGRLRLRAQSDALS